MSSLVSSAYLANHLNVPAHRYLSEYLYNWIITTLTRAECLAEQGKCSSKSKKAKPKKKPTKIYCREIMFSQALKNMFFGYYSVSSNYNIDRCPAPIHIFFVLQALAGFTKDNRIPQPLSMFDNEQIRFDHRFSPFYGLTTPPPVPYIQFSEYRAYTLKNTSQNLYTEASSYFHRARTILEVIPSPDAEVSNPVEIAANARNNENWFTLFRSPTSSKSQKLTMLLWIYWPRAIKKIRSCRRFLISQYTNIFRPLNKIDRG